MKKRLILTLAGLAIFIAVIAVVKIRQVQAGIAQNASFQPPPEAVTTVRAVVDRWPASIDAIGTGSLSSYFTNIGAIRSLGRTSLSRIKDRSAGVRRMRRGRDRGKLTSQSVPRRRSRKDA